MSTEVVFASDNLSREKWMQFVSEHPRGSVFHTPYIVDVYNNTKGFKAVPLAVIDDSHEILSLLVAVQTQVYKGMLGRTTSHCIIHAEPLYREDERGIAALNKLLSAYDKLVGRSAIFSEVRFLQEPGPLDALLLAQHYKRDDYLNFTLDLQQPLDKLWQNMKSCRRRNVRRAEKNGLEWVEVTDEQQLPTVYELLDGTFRRAGLSLHDYSLFQSLWRTLRPQGMIKFYFVKHEGKPIQTSVLLFFRGRVHYWYLGSLCRELATLRTDDFAYWQSIKLGVESGCKLFDWGGAGRPGELNSLRNFKSKFGGELVNYGRYRKTYTENLFTPAYKAYKAFQHLKRDIGTLVSTRPGENIPYAEHEGELSKSR